MPKRLLMLSWEYPPRIIGGLARVVAEEKAHANPAYVEVDDPVTTHGAARALIADVVPADRRGTAYAVYSTMTGVAVIVGGYGLGWLWNARSPEMVFGLAGLGSLAAGLLLVLFFWKSFTKRRA